MALSDNVAFTELLSLQELDDMLKEYDMKRDSVKINHDAPQWSHHAVWNRKYMEPRPGYALEQLWTDSEPAVNKKRPLPMKYRQMTFSVPYRPFGILHAKGSECWEDRLRQSKFYASFSSPKMGIKQIEQFSDIIQSHPSYGSLES